MILEKDTFDKYGYYPSQLKRVSNQRIIVSCDYCRGIVERTKAATNTGRLTVNKDCCKKCHHIKLFECQSVRKGIDISANNKEYQILLSNRKKSIEIGQEFMFLTVISLTHSIDGRKRHVLCQCKCGEQREVRIDSLKSGKSQSCGCFHKISHGGSHCETSSNGRKSKLYSAWDGIKCRCKKTERQQPCYKRYNITVCEEWSNFESFRDWSLNNGYKDGLTIDRINPFLGYSPSNCQWITKSENSRRIAIGRDEIIHKQQKEINKLNSWFHLDSLEYYI